MTRALTLKQDFYKTTITLTTGVGAGKIYIAVLPTRSAGYLVISPSNSVKREIVYYDSIGTDGTGNYVNIAAVGDRGLGGTTAQEHISQEPIRQNITALDWEDMVATFAGKFDVADIDTDGTLAADSDDKVPSQKAVKTYAMPLLYLDTDVNMAADSDTRVASQKAAKAYMDGLAIAGAPNASTTTKGLVEEATQAQVDAQVAVGETGARLFINPSSNILPPEIKFDTSLAGENLAAGEIVFVAVGTETQDMVRQITYNDSRKDTWLYQSFTTSSSVTSIETIELKIQTGGAATWTVKIRATPTGSDLYTTNDSVGGSVNAFRAYSPALTVSPSTTYYVLISAMSANFQGWIGSSTNVYAGGVSGESADGVTYTTPATGIADFCLKIFEKNLTAGRIYKATADNNNYIGSSWQNCIGLVKTTVLAGAAASIQCSNIFKSLSGLSTGLLYYLSNTPGAIATSAGTVSKKIGTALSATSLLIKHDN